MSPERIIDLIGTCLGAAATAMRLIGDVVNAKRVEDILKDGGFPGFERRAAAVGDEIKDRLSRGAGSPE